MRKQSCRGLLLAGLLVARAADAYEEDFEGTTPLQSRPGVVVYGYDSNWNWVQNEPKSAFFNQPVWGENVSVARVAPPSFTTSYSGGQFALGGDYWDGPYPIGKSGERWLGSSDQRLNYSSDFYGKRRPEADMGWVYLTTFDLAEQPYVSFLIGGSNEQWSTGIGLIADSVSPATVTAQCVNMPASGTCPSEYRTYSPNPAKCCPYYLPQPGEWITAWDMSTGWVNQATGEGSEQFSQRTWYLNTYDAPGGAWTPQAYPPGVNVRFLVFDWSTTGHINVDRIKNGPSWPTFSYTKPNPIWGYADTHSHWLQNIGSGAAPADPDANNPDSGDYLDTVGMVGIIWGAPWVRSKGNNLTPRDRFRFALPRCDGDNHDALKAGRQELWKDNPIFTFTRADSLRANGVTAKVITSLEGAGKLEENENSTGHAGCGVDPACFHCEWGFDSATGRFNSCTHNSYNNGARPWMTTTHQQMYWTWVKRAWQGGLRVMINISETIRALDALLHKLQVTEKNGNGDRMLAAEADNDLDVHARQTCALKKLSNESEIRDFARVVYTPAEARAVAGNGYLAILLGFEHQEIGSYFPTAEQEIDHIYETGVRHMFLTHIFNTTNGGAGVYTELWNTGNAFQNNGHCGNRRERLESSNGLTNGVEVFGTVTGFGTGALPGRWSKRCFARSPATVQGTGTITLQAAANPTPFSTISDGCSGLTPGDGQCVQWKQYANPRKNFPDGGFDSNTEAAIADLSLGGGYLFELKDNLDNPYGFPTATAVTIGSTNSYGLTARGYSAAQRIMARGMFLEVDHLSQKGAEQILGGPTAIGIPNGSAGTITPGISFKQPMAYDCNNPTIYASNAWCKANQYPVMANHTQVRQVALLQKGTANALGNSALAKWETENKAFWSRELDRKPDHITRIYGSGGMMGLGLSNFRKQPDTTPGLADQVTLEGKQIPFLHGLLPVNCEASSKSWNVGYYYMRHHFNQKESANVFQFPIGFGSDMNGILAFAGPRFNVPAGSTIGAGTRFGYDAIQDNACWGRRNDLIEDAGLIQAERNGQVSAKNAVVYNGAWASDTTNAATWQASPLVPLTFEGQDAGVGIVPNINYHGVLNYGMIPDMFQDMVNSAQHPTATGPTDAKNKWAHRQAIHNLENLFSSAEGVIKQWERSIAACKARCTSGACEALCNPSRPADHPAEYTGNYAYFPEPTGALCNVWMPGTYEGVAKESAVIHGVSRTCLSSGYQYDACGEEGMHQAPTY